MNAPVPENHLDRAIRATARSQAAMPDLLRALTEGEIWFLMEHHPDLAGEELRIENGSPLPFIIMEDDKGKIVPLFSSGERLDEALKKPNAPKKKFMAGAMPARQAMEILGVMNFRAVINQGCATGFVTIGPKLMRDLADGTALQPMPMDSGQQVTRSFSLLNPADYPTNLIQPLFEHLRRHANFRAAWVFGEAKGAAPASSLPKYYLLVLMQPRDEKLFHDFNLIAQAAKGKQWEVELSLANETDEAEIAHVFQQAMPFFKAADYQPPKAP